MKRFIILFLLSLSFSISLSAQEKDSTQFVDVVYLQDGSEFRGTILKYKIGEELKMRLRSGTELTIPSGVIKKVVQEPGVMPDMAKPYQFKERGWYNVTYGGFMGGRSDWDGDFELGLCLDNVTGYQFNRMLGLGLGVGVHTYYPESGETVFPVYAEARGYFLPQRVSPYYALALGYGFAFRNENQDIQQARGGYLVHPAVGLRFGGAQSHFIMDAGVRIQRATWERSIFGWWGPESIQTQKMTYARVVMRFGILF